MTPRRPHLVRLPVHSPVRFPVRFLVRFPAPFFAPFVAALVVLAVLVAPSCLAAQEAAAQSSTESAESPPRLAPDVASRSVELHAGGDADGDAGTETPAGVTDLFRALGEAAGVDVAFAPRLESQKVTWSGGPRRLVDALDELSRRSGTFWVATGPASIFVANDTPQQRRTYEPMTVATFALEHSTTKDMMTALRSIYGLKHVRADETRGLITVRDTADTVALARDLVAKLDVRPPATRVRLELVALGPDGDAVETLLSADAALVGRDDAGVRVNDAPYGDDTWLDLAVTVDSRSDGDQLRLDLRVESGVTRRDGEKTYAATRGSWQSRGGEPFLVQLPLHLDAESGRRELALRVTPTVTDAGETTQDAPVWVGTEAAIRAPRQAP